MKKLINIKGNLINDIKIIKLDKSEKENKVANFIILKKYGKIKEKINCNFYFSDDSLRKYLCSFKKNEYIHVFGYFEDKIKNERKYKNFIIKSIHTV